MTQANPLRVIELNIPALVRKDRATLLDRNGRAICTVRLGRLGIPPADAVEERLWKDWASRMVLKLFALLQRQPADPWQKKAQGLAVSFRLRRRQRSPKSQRKMLDNFRTTGWRDASTRMVLQACNRFRRHDRSGWNRWSHTVSSNQNKRVDAWRTRRT